MADIETGIRIRDLTRDGMRRVQQSVRRGTDSIKSDLDETGQAAGRAGDSIGGMGSALSSLGGVLGGIGIAGAGAAFIGFANSALASADELQRLSDRVGVSAETLQEWQFIAKSTGADADDVADAFREMQLRLSEAARLGSGPAVDALMLLGLTLDDLAGMDAAQQFELLRDAISEVEDPADRLFLAEELLGGSTERLGAFIEGTAEEMAALRQEARDTGQILSDETVASLDGAHAAFGRLTTALNNFAIEGLVKIIDALPGVDLGLEEAAEAATYMDEQVELLDRQILELNSSIENLANDLGTSWSQGLNDSADALRDEVEALEAKRDILLDVEEAVETQTDLIQEYEDALRGVTDVTFEQVDATDDAGEAAEEATSKYRDFTSALNVQVNWAQAGAVANSAWASSAREAASAAFDLTVQLDQQAEAHVELRRAAAVGRIGGSGELVYTGRTQRRRTAPGGSGGGGGGGGGRSASTREERPPRVRLGDYLFEQRLFDQDDVELLRRFGPSDTFGNNQAINLSQNIAELSESELDTLVERVLNVRSRARRRDAQARREEREEEARKKQEEELKRIADATETLKRQPCPPVTIQGSVVTEKDLEAVIVDIQQQVTPRPETRSPISGAQGI